VRKFYIISYDIPDDKRRTRISKLLSSWGERIQFSVFCCQLNPREQHKLTQHISDLIKQNEDQVFLVEVGKVSGEHPTPEITYFGKPWEPEPRTQII